jgi:hypothetical protein
MRNVAPSRSLVRRANQFKSLAFLVGAVGAFLTAVGVLMNVVPLVGANDPSFSLYNFIRGLATIAGILLLIAAAGILIRAFTWRTDNDLAQMTAQALGRELDDRYTFVRNVSKLEIGYIDAVLIGPPGALVFRIVDAEGDWANEGANWLIRKSSGDFLPAPFNPTKEDQVDIEKLDAYLKKKNVHDVPIFGVVVFTKDERRVRLSAREPVLPITHLHMLMVNLRDNYLAQERINMNIASQVVRLVYGE